MSYDPSRKRFFAKLIGLIAAAGIAPKLLASRPVTAVTAAQAGPSIRLRPEFRAVARNADSV